MYLCHRAFLGTYANCNFDNLLCKRAPQLVWPFTCKSTLCMVIFLSYMIVCNLLVSPVGSFMAGWPFAHTVERYSWTSAYYLLEVASVVMVGLASYLLILLLRGLAANRQKQKQN